MKYQLLLSMGPYDTMLAAHLAAGPADCTLGTEGLLLYEWFWMRQCIMVEKCLDAQLYHFLTGKHYFPTVKCVSFKGSSVILGNNNAPKLIVSLTLLSNNPWEAQSASLPGTTILASFSLPGSKIFREASR